MEHQLATTENDVSINQQIDIYHNASLLQIKPEEQQTLTADFDANLIEIRPDGLIYLPQVFWRERLNKAFGTGQWVLIPKSQIKDPNISKLYIEGVLMVRGHYVATAVGEAEYHQDNPNQSWASVWESAKSDCITRCCKDLGIAAQLWQPDFINKWIDKYAVKVWVTNKDNKKKPSWRKKDAKPFWNEDGQKKQQDQHPKSPDDQTGKKSVATAYNRTPLETEKKPLITNEQFNKACDRLRTGELDIIDKTLAAFSLVESQVSLMKHLKDGYLKEQEIMQQTQTADENRMASLWTGKVDKCKTLAALSDLYNKSRETVEANPVIKQLFTARKKELQKQQ